MVDGRLQHENLVRTARQYVPVHHLPVEHGQLEQQRADGTGGLASGRGAEASRQQAADLDGGADCDELLRVRVRDGDKAGGGPFD